MELNLGQAAASVQQMLDGFLALLPRIVLGLVVFGGFWLAARGVRTLIKRSIRRGGAAQALGRLAQMGVILGGFLVAATIAFPSVRPADALGVLGIGGVAIGFAFRDILQNYFAGIILLWREPFRVGDQIETSKGYAGTIQDIQTRATFLMTYDGRRVVIPNTDLFTDSVTVNTAQSSRRNEYDVGVGYGDDIETAKGLILEAVSGLEGVAREPAPRVLTHELAGSSVNLRLWWWSASTQLDTLETRDRVLSAVKSKLSENGVDLPFPTQVVLVHDQTEATDGDRARQREGWPVPAGGDAPRAARLGSALRAALGEGEAAGSSGDRQNEDRQGGAQPIRDRHNT